MLHTGNISAVSETRHAYAGGIVGEGSTDTASNLYNTGNISVKSLGSSGYRGCAGGIFGEHSSGPLNPYNLVNSYNVGEVSNLGNESYLGGLIGQVSHAPDLSICYFSDSVASVAIGWARMGGSLNDSVQALSDSQMRQQASYVGFDFTNTWAISLTVNNGYPYLQGTQP